MGERSSTTVSKIWESTPALTGRSIEESVQLLRLGGTPARRVRVDERERGWAKSQSRRTGQSENALLLRDMYIFDFSACEICDDNPAVGKQILFLRFVSQQCCCEWYYSCTLLLAY